MQRFCPFGIRLPIWDVPGRNPPAPPPESSHCGGTLHSEPCAVLSDLKGPFHQVSILSVLRDSVIILLIILFFLWTQPGLVSAGGALELFFIAFILKAYIMSGLFSFLRKNGFFSIIWCVRDKFKGYFYLIFLFVIFQFYHKL